MPKLFLSIVILLYFSHNFLYSQSPGSVSAIQKISNTYGGLGNVLGANGNFGNRIAKIGDLDSDGVLDIAVGEEYADDGGADRGAVWILFMKADGTVKAKQKISQTNGNLGLTLSNGVRFGFSVAGIGDLNNDGVLDIAVGSIIENSYSGAVWILFLNTNGTVKSTAKIDKNTTNFTSLANYDFFGCDISNLGDVNGDGVADIVVSAPQDDNGGTDKGAAYVIFLNTNGSVKSYQKISNTQGGFSATLDNFDILGISVSGLGDINGDGIPDLAVGASGDDDGITNSGAAYILTLNKNGTVKSYSKLSNLTITTNNILSNDGYFGRSISGTSDKNGDGINDLFVGASQDDGGGFHRGAVYLFHLDSNQNVKSYIKYGDQTTTALSSSLDDGDKLGTSVVSLDNFATGAEHVFATGALFDDDGATNAGAIYMMFLVPPPAPPKPTAPDIEIANVVLPKDSICSDSFVTAKVFLKNHGDTSVLNPMVNFKLNSGQLVSQTFTHNGILKSGDSVSFNVKLNLSNSGNTSITAYSSHLKDTIKTNDTFKTSVVIISIKADFSATNACFGETNSFLNQSTFKGTKNVSYAWDFGDGFTSTDTDPMHVYAAGGEYTVTLTASSSGCSETFTQKVTAYALPKVVFATNTTCLGKNSNFNANLSLSGQSLRSIEWDFGDNTSDTGNNLSHTYKTAGTFTVKAIVTTTNGCVGEYSRNITIEATPQTGHTRVNDTLFANAINAASYQWYKNGIAISNATGNYYVISEDAYYNVLVSSASGCKDSAVSILENKIKVKNFISGIIKQSNGQPLKVSMVIFGQINKTDSIVNHLDTAWTDQNGKYDFETIEKEFVLFAVPSSSLYPNEIITYYNSSLTIQDAAEQVLNYGNHVFNFSTQARKTVSGPLNLSAKVKNCATCKNANNEVKELPLILMNSNQEPVYRLNTNINGEVLFPALSPGKYYLWADKLFINNSIAPEIEVSEDIIMPVKITLYPTYITAEVTLKDTTKDTSTVIMENNSGNNFSVSVFPNPSTGKYTITNKSASVEKLVFSVSTLDGKIFKNWISQSNKTENFDLGNAPAGIYFLKIQSAENVRTIKLIKN